MVFFCLSVGLLAAACGGGDSSSTSAAGASTGESTAAAGGGPTVEDTGESERGGSTGEGGGKSGGGSGTRAPTTEGGGSSGSGSASKGGSKGGGSSEGEGSNSKSGAGARSSSATAALIHQGDAICARAKKEQVRGVQEFVKTQDPEVSGKAAIEELTLQAGLPPIKKAVAKLKGLQPPPGAVAEFDAVVNGLDKALAEAEADPSAIIDDPESPFDEPNRLAREFGFKACGGMA